LAQRLEHGLLLVVVLRTLLVVLLLFEEAEALPFEGLRPLAVRSPLDTVAVESAYQAVKINLYVEYLPVA
jgi:hypothetical protein